MKPFGPIKRHVEIKQKSEKIHPMAALLKLLVLFAKETTVSLRFISDKDWTVEYRSVIIFPREKNPLGLIFCQSSVLAGRVENSVDCTTLCGSQFSRATDTLTVLLFFCFCFCFSPVLTLLPFLKFSSSNITFWLSFFSFLGGSFWMRVKKNAGP